jgi:hypothetical protein
MENEKITRENVAMHLVEYQLRMVNKSIIDMVNDDQWRFNITLTAIQTEQFKQYAISLLKKTFKCNKSIASSIFEWFNVLYSLRIKN